MRLDKEFGVRTTNPKERKRKFFLVFEGEKTEPQYFEGIQSNQSELGISAIVEIKHLMRSKLCRGWSNPKKIVDLLLKELNEKVDGKISGGHLIHKICEYVFDRCTKCNPCTIYEKGNIHWSSICLKIKSILL